MSDLLCLAVSSNGWVAAGDSVMMSSRPQIPFQPHGMFIPKYIAEKFIINDIIIGQRVALTVAHGALPGELFEAEIGQEDIELIRTDGVPIRIKVEKKGELFAGRNWKFPKLMEGNSISIHVTSICAIATQFRAVFIGAEPEEEKRCYNCGA